MYPCAAFGFGHGRNQWRSCILRVLAWQRIKDREVNGMKRRILTVCLLLALLLFAAAAALFQWGFPWAAANIPFLQQMSNFVAAS